jgi:hypothetical protein
MPEAREEEFFVGYLALSAKTKRFVLAVAVACFALLLALAALAAALRDPAARTTQATVTLVGKLDARAYGVLWTVQNGAPTPILIAGGGKFGVPPAAKQLFGQNVEARGLQLERDGYRMLELSKIVAQPKLDDEIERTLSRVATRALGTLKLEGEIVDIKCWLGRMKPGDGRTHRACAQFCIQGGIPPVLVARSAGGVEARGSVHGQERVDHYVLTDLSGGPINDAVLPYVAEAVTLEGQAERVGSMLFLRIDPSRIRRL